MINQEVQLNCNLRFKLLPPLAPAVHQPGKISIARSKKKLKQTIHQEAERIEQKNPKRCIARGYEVNKATSFLAFRGSTFLPCSWFFGGLHVPSTIIVSSKTQSLQLKCATTETQLLTSINLTISNKENIIYTTLDRSYVDYRCAECQFSPSLIFKPDKRMQSTIILTQFVELYS